eukprot:379778-Pelagomonas_calceolata.AAC.1
MLHSFAAIIDDLYDEMEDLEDEMAFVEEQGNTTEASDVMRNEGCVACAIWELGNQALDSLSLSIIIDYK